MLKTAVSPDFKACQLGLPGPNEEILPLKNFQKIKNKKNLPRN